MKNGRCRMHGGTSTGPSMPSPGATSRPLPSHYDGSPPITRNHLSNVPCPLPRRRAAD
ncbi:MAG: hypothetical protein ACJ8E2_04635 [Bradyrhizobium sp.]